MDAEQRHSRSGTASRMLAALSTPIPTSLDALPIIQHLYRVLRHSRLVRAIPTCRYVAFIGLGVWCVGACRVGAAVHTGTFPFTFATLFWGSVLFSWCSLMFASDVDVFGALSMCRHCPRFSDVGSGSVPAASMYDSMSDTCTLDFVLSSYLTSFVRDPPVCVRVPHALEVPSDPPESARPAADAASPDIIQNLHRTTALSFPSSSRPHPRIATPEERLCGPFLGADVRRPVRPGPRNLLLHTRRLCLPSQRRDAMIGAQSVARKGSLSLYAFTLCLACGMPQVKL